MTPRHLVKSFHTPPFLAAGGSRWTGLSRHRVRFGCEVRVVAASPGAGSIVYPEGTSQQNWRASCTGCLLRQAEYTPLHEKT